MQLARSGDHSRAMPLKHGGQCVRALRCHQGNLPLGLAQVMAGEGEFDRLPGFHFSLPQY